MAQTIQIKNGTGSSAPATLLQGEFAINVSTHSNWCFGEITASNRIKTQNGTNTGTGNITASGTITAGSFVGDGSGLTGLSSGGAISSYTNNGDNRVLTSVNSNTVNAEANLTFDGTHLNVNGNVTASGEISASGGVYADDYYSKGQAVLNYSLGQDRIVVGNKPTLIQGNLTASGEISASGAVNVKSLRIDGTALSSVIAGTTVATAEEATSATEASTVIVTNSTANSEAPVVFHNESNGLRDDTGTFTYNASTGRLTVPRINSTNITASGDISASGTIVGNVIESDQLFNRRGDANTGVQLGNDTVILQGNDVIIGKFASTYINLNKDISNTLGTDVVVDDSLKVNQYLNVASNITSSGEISASGAIYSGTEECIFLSFQLSNGATSGSYYGANSQGPYYYYWNKEYTSYPNVGLSHYNSGYKIPYKIELISMTWQLHCLSTGLTGNSATCELLVIDREELGNPPYEAGSAVNNSIKRGQQLAIITDMDTRYATYEATATLTGSVSANSMLYPRIAVDLSSKNWRGNFTLKYRRIK